MQQLNETQQYLSQLNIQSAQHLHNTKQFDTLKQTKQMMTDEIRNGTIFPIEAIQFMFFDHNFTYLPF